MSQFLLTLAGLSLGGGIAVLVLALAGRSTRARYGARWRCWAWVLLCLRLAVPLSLVPQAREAAPIQLPLPQAGVLSPVSPTPVQPGPDSSAPAEEVSPGGDLSAPAGTGAGDVPASGGPSLPALSPQTLLFALWLAGALGVLGWSLAAHLRFLAWLRRWATPADSPEVVRAFQSLGDQLGLSRRPRLLVCPGLKVPMLAGLFRPALLLPQGPMEGQALGYSLLHELTHYRRRDIWLKALALWVRAVHWFNPLCWLMGRLIERDTELACDEAALAALPPSEHAAYGQTILSAAAHLR